jgi:hypothetical protein
MKEMQMAAFQIMRGGLCAALNLRRIKPKTNYYLNSGFY